MQFPRAHRAAAAAARQRAHRRDFEGTYRNDKGPIERVIDELCIFLRDHHSGEKTQIDVGVIDVLADVLDAVGETKATILSAYRTAETNAMLARTTFGVAEHSQHIEGRALDIRDCERPLRPSVIFRKRSYGASGEPVQLIQALPYLLTVILLAGFIGKAVAPKAGGCSACRSFANRSMQPGRAISA
jgi:hypothetical protein